MSDSQDAQISVRMPQDLLDRVEDLRPRMEKASVGVSSVSRSEAIRTALLRGVEALEDELPEGD